MDECKNCANIDNEYCFACDNGSQFKSATYADLIRNEKDDARLAALLMEIRCANCAFWGFCYRFVDTEHTIIEGKAKQDCTADLYNWLHQEVGTPGTYHPWGKCWEK